MAVNPDCIPIVEEWLRESDNADTRALRAQTLEIIADLRRQLAERNAEIEAVYALGTTPVEQSRAIPLAQWVRTRFVRVEEHNAKMTDLLRERDDARAACAEMRCNIGTAHVMLGERKTDVARRLLGRILAKPNPGQPLLDELVMRRQMPTWLCSFCAAQWRAAEAARAGKGEKP